MDPSELWLRDWHDAHAGATSRAFFRANPSTYAWLATHAHPGDRVLDLACGDGALLELLLTRGVEQPVGLDMSDGELSAARGRLGSAASLVQGRAQELPFADASFDEVTCHLALMLMRPVEQAIAEVQRILRPGGSFSAVVSGGLPAEQTANAWTMLIQHLRVEAFEGPAIGDRRTLSEEGLRELLRGFSDVKFERFSVDLSGSPDDIVGLFHDTYDVARIAPDRVTQLEQALRLEWQTIQRPDGRVPCFLSVIGIHAVR